MPLLFYRDPGSRESGGKNDAMPQQKTKPPPLAPENGGTQQGLRSGRHPLTFRDHLQSAAHSVVQVMTHWHL